MSAYTHEDLGRLAQQALAHIVLVERAFQHAKIVAGLHKLQRAHGGGLPSQEISEFIAAVEAVCGEIKP